MMLESLPGKDWRVGDVFYGQWHYFEITHIGKKSWGQIPMGVRWVEGHCKPDPRCVGVKPITTQGPAGFGMTVDPQREPEQFNALRCFREGVEIWRDTERTGKWPDSYAVEDASTDRTPRYVVRPIGDDLYDIHDTVLNGSMPYTGSPEELQPHCDRLNAPVKSGTAPKALTPSTEPTEVQK